ncbi:MAG: hypothetical protein JXB23_04335, partial [Candidatus Aminicenantes bacterium]|nr:hypothetical protein [Candidatus Aminicenantes bacterium]
ANAHRIEAIVPVKQLIAGLKQGYALAGLVGALKTEVAKTSETLTALRDEYKATLAGVSGKVQAGFRHLAEEQEAKYIDEKARLHERLMQIKAEYRGVKERIEELSADLGILLNIQPSLSVI